MGIKLDHSLDILQSTAILTACRSSAVRQPTGHLKYMLRICLVTRRAIIFEIAQALVEEHLHEQLCPDGEEQKYGDKRLPPPQLARLLDLLACHRGSILARSHYHPHLGLHSEYREAM